MQKALLPQLLVPWSPAACFLLLTAFCLLLSAFYLLEELLKPLRGEIHGAPAVNRLRQPMISPLNDMNLLGAA